MLENTQNTNPAELTSLPPDLFARNTLITFLIQKLIKWPSMRVLDVGGYGGKLQKFLPESTKFYIVDPKPNPKEQPQPNKPAPTYIQADGRKMPFSDNNFDVVIGSDLLEHVEFRDRPKIIQEMLRVTKNYLILGMPSQNNLVATAEDLIRQQYQKNAGNAHPFLSEHQTFGLPEEEKLEQFFTNSSLSFCKIKQGNLMNWYIQQLYSTTKHGELISENEQKFNRFFNEKLYELGNLRAPTYRTIYCIAKKGAALPAEEIQAELEQKYLWSAEAFIQLLRFAFDDLRAIIDQRKLQIEHLKGELKLTHDHSFNLETKVGIARKSVQAHREAISEMRNFLIEKEQALNFMKAILHEKDSTIGNLEANNKAISEELERQKTFLEKLSFDLENKSAEIASLHDYVNKNEHNLKQSWEKIKDQEALIQAIKTDLVNHQKSLWEIQKSRSWKLIMFYSRLKISFIINPLKLAKKSWEILTKLGPKEFMRRVIRKIKKSPQFESEISAYQQYLQNNSPTAENFKVMSEEIENFEFRPVISIVMPVYNIDEKWLVKAIDSVRNQAYGRFELCICDDASTQQHIKKVLEKYAAMDKRIKVIYRPKNGGIVKASNDALNLATGAYVGLLDNDDELTSDALYEVVKNLQETKYDLIYSDEDKLEMDGTPCEPFFKPDWSPDLLLSINYISHFGVYRRKLVNELGGFREGFDGSQDYDLVLRFTEKTQSIKHIPKILYHWRKIPGSTATVADAKPYAFESAKKALAQALKRRNITGNITDGLWTGSYRLKRAIKSTEPGTITEPESGAVKEQKQPAIKGPPLVSVIIPFKDKIEVTQVCITSIITKTTYSNYEILLVDNRSELLETAEYLKKLSTPGYDEYDSRIKVLKYDAPFNFSAINNFAVKQAQGEILVLLNNDTEVLTPDWIESMLEHAQRPEVGAVGAKLLYPNNTVQHAGVLIGVGGLANHAFCRQHRDDHGYFGQADLIRNYSAVTAACVMIRKDVFEKMGGLDEKNLAVGFNDVDLCLRLREKDYLIVYTPYAQLYHYESLSRGFDINMQEVQFIQRRHAGMLEKGDPYYNPNLTKERFDFSLRIADKI